MSCGQNIFAFLNGGRNMYVLNLHRNFMEGDFGKRVLRDDKGVTCSFTLLKCFFYFFFQLKNSFMCREDGLVAKRSL